MAVTDGALSPELDGLKSVRVADVESELAQRIEALSRADTSISRACSLNLIDAPVTVLILMFMFATVPLLNLYVGFCYAGDREHSARWAPSPSTASDRPRQCSGRREPPTVTNPT